MMCVPKEGEIMEKTEKNMRPIPKNVRQIGERDDEIKLYVEDYVNTFIRENGGGSADR